MKRIVTKLRIVHVTRDANGYATSYRGEVLRGSTVVAQTPVVTDGLVCLRLAESAEAAYRKGL